MKTRSFFYRRINFFDLEQKLDPNALERRLRLEVLLSLEHLQFDNFFFQGGMWLQRLEANASGTEGDFLFGTKVTYADFCVFNVIRAVREMYGNVTLYFCFLIHLHQLLHFFLFCFLPYASVLFCHFLLIFFVFLRKISLSSLRLVSASMLIR